MKKILVGFGVVMALAITALGILTWRIDDIVAAYKPLLQTKVSELLGTEVAFGDLELSLIPHPSLSVSKVVVGEHTGQKPDISLRSLSARAALLPLLRRRLELSTITLEKPVITLVNTPQGTTIRGLKLNADKKATEPSASQPSTPHTVPEQATSLTIAIERVLISDGTVVIERPDVVESIRITDIDLNSGVSFANEEISIPDTDLSLQVNSTPMSAQVSNLLFNQTTKGFSIGNALLTTHAGVLKVAGSSSPQGKSSTLQVSTDGLDIARLLAVAKTLLPQFSTPAVTGSLTSNLTLGIANGTIASVKGPVTLSSVTVDLPNSNRVRSAEAEISLEGAPRDLLVALRKGSFQYNDAPVAVTADARLRRSELTLTTLTLKGFGGELQAPLRLELTASPVLSARPSATSLSIQSLLKAIGNPAASFLSGTLASFNGDFTSISLTDPAATITGPGSIRVKDGVIRGMNLPNQLLTKINGLPFIQGDLRKRVPPEFEPLVSKPDTVIRELSSRFSLRAGIVSMSELFVSSDLFDLKGSGTYALAGDVTINAQVLFDPELSRALVERVKELKPLVNSDGKMVLPIALSGKPPAVVVTPDLKGLAQSVSVDALRQTLGDALKNKKGFKKDLGKILGF